MKTSAPGSFGACLKELRETAGFTQEELAAIAGLSVHAISALERSERRRPHVDTVRALAAALNLSESARDVLMKVARASIDHAAADELSGVSFPLALTSLIGREADTKTLRRWLDDPAARLITLVGPGGVGKTRLALEVGRMVTESGPSRAVLIELAGIRDPVSVPLAVAQGMGLSDSAALDLPRHVRAACHDEHPFLLILDNCEQVLGAAPLVANLVAGIPMLRVLATSRAPLRVRGERQYDVAPLAYHADAEAMTPADLALQPPVRLFIERVRDVHPTFRLTTANAQSVAAICRRLDGLPLALELAAPWMKSLTAEDLLQRLNHDGLLSGPGARDLPERQQTITTTVSWSYQLLDEAERRAFRRFGALPGRFGAEAAEAVLGGTRDSTDATTLAAIAGLIDKSLLSRADVSTAARPVYQMLETVRAFAGHALDASNERDDAVEGLVGYCGREAARAERGLVGLEQVDWLERVRENLDNYRCVLAWLLAHGRPSDAAEVAWQLMFYWLIRGRTGEGLRWYEQALALPGLQPSAESRALVGAAVMAFTRGDIASARACSLRGLTVAQAAGETAIAVHAGHLLGHIEQASGNRDAACDLFRRSAEQFTTIGLPWAAGNAFMGLASASLAGGHIDQAERWLDQATSVLRDAGPWFLNLPLYLRAIIAVQRGAADTAIALVHESLVCSRDLKDRFAFVYALIPLAAAASMKGDAAWVARILGTRDSVTERAGATVSDASLRVLRDRAEQHARERLGPVRWARAYAAGRTASIDLLLNDIEHVTA